MASFVFENGTQAQASSFQSGDRLIFQSASPTTLGVTYTAASGFSTDTVTLTFGAQSLTFSAAALNGGSKEFLASGGTLVTGTGGADGALALSGAAASAAYGFAGADTVTVTGAGNHVVDGGSGGDTITATAATGALYIYGGDGGDTISGGTGNDHIYGNTLSAVQGSMDGADSISGGDGADYINGNAGNDTISGGNGDDRIFGGNGDDSIVGDNGNDQINGNRGNDTISGGNGNDIIRGGQGDDVLNGNNGNDIIYGDLGADTLNGGQGYDVLFGGDGADRFVFATGDSPVIAGATGTDALADVIGDYVDGTDKINLSGITSGTTVVVLTSTTNFANGFEAQQFAQTQITAGAATSGEVYAAQVGTDTYLFAAQANGSTIDTAIKVIGVSASVFNATDFIVG